MARTAKRTKAGAPSQGRRSVSAPREIEDILVSLERRIRKALSDARATGLEGLNLDEAVVEAERFYTEVWFQSEPPRRKAVRVEDLYHALDHVRRAREAATRDDPWQLAIDIHDAVGNWLAGAAWAKQKALQDNQRGGETRSEAARNSDLLQQYLKLRKEQPKLKHTAAMDEISRRNQLNIWTGRKAIGSDPLKK